jgi:hypothetical protein
MEKKYCQRVAFFLGLQLLLCSCSHVQKKDSELVQWASLDPYTSGHGQMKQSSMTIPFNYELGLNESKEFFLSMDILFNGEIFFKYKAHPLTLESNAQHPLAKPMTILFAQMSEDVRYYLRETVLKDTSYYNKCFEAQKDFCQKTAGHLAVEIRDHSIKFQQSSILDSGQTLLVNWIFYGKFFSGRWVFSEQVLDVKMDKKNSLTIKLFPALD